MLEEGCDVVGPPTVHHGTDWCTQKVSEVPQIGSRTGILLLSFGPCAFWPITMEKAREGDGHVAATRARGGVQRRCRVTDAAVSAPGNFDIIWYSVQLGCCGGVNVLPVTSILLAQRFLTPPVPGHEWDDLPPFGAADAQVWFHLSWPLADLRRQSQADFANSFLWSRTWLINIQKCQMLATSSLEYLGSWKPL